MLVGFQSIPLVDPADSHLLLVGNRFFQLDRTIEIIHFELMVLILQLDEDLQLRFM